MHSGLSQSCSGYRLFWFSVRLRSQLSEKEADHAEALASAQAKYSSEIQNLKEILASSEANNTDLQKEVRKKKMCSSNLARNETLRLGLTESVDSAHTIR